MVRVSEWNEIRLESKSLGMEGHVERFVYISLEEMREVLGVKEGKWNEVRYEGRRETEFHQEVKERLKVVIYSSISKGVSRDKGKDAIRLVPFWEDDKGEWKSLGKGRKIYRVQTWKENLAKAIAQVSELFPEFCNECKAPYTVRIRKIDGGKFLGCMRFPLCKRTKEIKKCG